MYLSPLLWGCLKHAWLMSVFYVLFMHAKAAGLLCAGRHGASHAPQRLPHCRLKCMPSLQLQYKLVPALAPGQGEKAFCSGGDQAVRGEGGYVGEDSVPRLNVLDMQACIPLTALLHDVEPD